MKLRSAKQIPSLDLRLEAMKKNAICIFPLTLSIFHQIGHMRASSDAEFTELQDGGIGFEIWSSIDEDI